MLRDQSEDDRHPMIVWMIIYAIFLHDALASRLRVLQLLLTGALLPLSSWSRVTVLFFHGVISLSATVSVAFL